MANKTWGRRRGEVSDFGRKAADFAVCLVLLHKKRYNIKTLALCWWQYKTEKVPL